MSVNGMLSAPEPDQARQSCPLCTGDGGSVVYQAAEWRVVRADEAGFPAFYRVVWTRHVAELSDLSKAERAQCLDAVVVVEQTLRQHLAPTKINLASLGNMVAHLHWHVIARFDWDSHFPGAVWAEALRARSQPGEAQVVAARAVLEADLARRLAECASGKPVDDSGDDTSAIEPRAADASDCSQPAVPSSLHPSSPTI